MDIEKKMRLARQNDMGIAACAIRLRAAYHVSGLPRHIDLANQSGISKTVLSNAMNGITYPNRAVLSYLYRAHRIDFNFMMIGLFAQLPGDVQEALFPALERATREWDQRENSGQSQASAPDAQFQT